MNDFVKICMVGAGRVGRQHPGSLTSSARACQVVAMVDPLVVVLAATADEFGLPERYASLEEAIAPSHFDAVVIATPPSPAGCLRCRASSSIRQPILPCWKKRTACFWSCSSKMR